MGTRQASWRQHLCGVRFTWRAPMHLSQSLQDACAPRSSPRSPTTAAVSKSFPTAASVGVVHAGGAAMPCSSCRGREERHHVRASHVVPGRIAVGTRQDRAGAITIEVTDGVRLPEASTPPRIWQDGLPAHACLGRQARATLKFRSTALRLSVRLRVPPTPLDGAKGVLAKKSRSRR